jgi:membrane protease YdiL (CAAX protease family)
VKASAGQRPFPPPHWLGTLLYVPLLSGGGWLLARPLSLLTPHWRPDQVDLAGAVIALLLLLLSLPLRLRRVWGDGHPWQRLGLTGANSAAHFLQGLLLATALLVPVAAVLLLVGLAQWRGLPSPELLANGLALLLGVGFAEELLFRGWLWGELELLLPKRCALGLQALVFALVHPWYLLPPLAGLALLGGLTLLGLALALLRRSQDGNLWGPIGLHGGLVGGWFLVQKGLVEIGADAPGWLVGPGKGDVNPIGGLLGWLGLGLLLALEWRQRLAVARARRPSTGACRASSRGARP